MSDFDENAIEQPTGNDRYHPQFCFPLYCSRNDATAEKHVSAEDWIIAPFSHVAAPMAWYTGSTCLVPLPIRFP